MGARSSRPRTLRTRLLGQRGAAAVEFALVVPMLLLLLMGIVEYSRVYQAQGTVSAAAREGVRVMALTNNASQARSAAQTAGSPLSLPNSGFVWSYSRGGLSSCSNAQPTDTVTLKITYRQLFASGLLGRTYVDVVGTASMRCGG
ncbi:TadE/TadG family type IV pilus assembly protein [Geodermatophilus amargosae]|uniref:TadE/TadG family type IV pilus assembly protein n=1 Tax=Geodermatophilus amargosae TaxID=1296565 RepID=UPI0034DEE05E